MAQEVSTGRWNEPVRQDVAAAPTYRIVRPHADVAEADDRILLMVDLPGVAPEDVDVTVERRVMTIRGKRQLPRPEGAEMLLREWTDVEFERAFTVSDDINLDGISATHKDGVLTLVLPKAKNAKSRKIKVQSH